MQNNTIPLQTLYEYPDMTLGVIREYDDKESKIPNKIIEMGLLPNTEFKILHRAPLEGPLYVEYGWEKTRVALRVEEAKFILVEPK